MAPTTFPDLNQVLSELVSSVEGILGMSFIGAYLQGSFAIGDYDQHSDVDFIMVIDRDLSLDQVEDLQEMHDRIYRMESSWAQHLEGSYFPKEVLQQSSMAGTDLWYLDHGARELIRSDHCNTILVRWIVRDQGVILRGPNPETLVDPITQEVLRTEIFNTLNYWGQVILDDPTPFNNWFYQGYIVLNFCRMLHDLNRGYPGSKREGAEWAKSTLNASWSELIDRAWEGRPDPATKIRQPADPEDFAMTLEFLKMIMKQSKKWMQKLG
jgi:hypothetical protein